MPRGCVLQWLEQKAGSRRDRKVRWGWQRTRAHWNRGATPARADLCQTSRPVGPSEPKSRKDVFSDLLTKNPVLGKLSLNCALAGKARGAQIWGAPTVSRASEMKPERAPVSSGQEAGVSEPARPRTGVALSNPQSVHLISGRNLSPAGRRGRDCVPAPGPLRGRP